MNVRDRFMAKVSKTDSCWLWTGAIDRHGYGTFTLSDNKRLAHRVAYELFVGNIPHEMCVCHHCDNRPCVNPEHLWVGTNADNVSDKILKGRSNQPSRVGRNNGRTKLSENDVAAARFISGFARVPARDIAFQLGISQSAARQLLSGDTWSHVK